MKEGIRFGRMPDDHDPAQDRERQDRSRRRAGAVTRVRAARARIYRTWLEDARRRRAERKPA